MGQGYPWDSLVVLWDLSGCLALYDGYLGVIDVFYYVDVVCVNWKVPNLILLSGLLQGLCRQPSYKFLKYYPFVHSFDFSSVKALLVDLCGVDIVVVCSLVFVK